jgi:hypothetical protein
LPNSSEAVKKYDLQKSFDDIGKRLNDFVHANGVFFYNKKQTDMQLLKN